MIPLSLVLLVVGLLQSPIIAAASINYTDIGGKNGDKLPDFSFCGYHASETDIPTKVVTQALSPGSGDQTANIQNALNAVHTNGGGVVGLHGTYELKSHLTIPNGTVLRGEGVNQTFLTVPDGSQHWINLGDYSGDEKTVQSSDITDDHLPVGSSEISVQSTDGFKAGQTIYVQRVVTQAWVDAQGMGYLYGNGYNWLTIGDPVKQPRTIQSISGNTIKLDIPLTDSITNTAPFSMKGQVVAYTRPQASAEVGLEDLSIHLSPSCSGTMLGNTTCSTAPIAFSQWVSDSWVRNLDLAGFMNFVTVNSSTSRLTIANVAMHRTAASNNSAGYAGDITLSGTQALVVNCSTWGDKDTKTYSVITTTLTPGPNAIVNYTSEQDVHQIEPHERWAHGFLVDNSRAPVYYIDRATAGSGHGWTINAGVAWNVNWPQVNISSAPNATNYCIGCQFSDKYNSNGTFQDSNEAIDPPSLFAAQLATRGYRG